VSLLETEQQRRWWFATHPEFSWGGTGRRSKRHDDDDGDSERIDPKAVDAYVDEQLGYATDPVIIQLLKSTKFWFGTEFASKSPAEKRALLRDEDDEDEEEEEDQTAQVEQPERPSGQLVANEDFYRKYGDASDSIERLQGRDPAKEAFIKMMMKEGWSKEWAESRWKIIKDNESMARAGAEALNFPRAARLGRAILDRVLRRVIEKPPPRLPPKGTPERAAIEAARERGINAKQAEELKDIRAGGKGSGIWSEEELAGIRRTGKFPEDAVWHHDPTVANRPDLAADPRVVHPMRGGSKAHLRYGHDMNWRNPRE
jgi:hypothetical protein